ncbi:ABC transporter ATP-binding protein [Desulfolithobacter sp.]
MLQVLNLAFNYNGSPILKGVDIDVRKGRMVTLAGPNGAGKTTLLKCIAGILEPAGGAVLIESQDAGDMHRKELARRLGYVPQSETLRFPMTVFETVLTGRSPHMAWRPSRKDLEYSARIIEEMNLGDLAMRDMDSLSGGQAQKVLLAKALAQEPDYLLLDEPTSSLDLHHQLEVLELVSGLVETKEMGALVAMHDLNLAARFSHTILLIRQGEIFCQGTPREVITPENIHAVYRVEAVVRHGNGHPYVQPLRCVADNENA